ncbi:hypothetical protein FAI41_04340 [Acetobacteraceae bacterium]|nr:hypothetical protein FAI41_04340 [Acetobacteraceae bacterium]
MPKKRNKKKVKMSKMLNINGYDIELDDNCRPDDYYHYVCEIVINKHFLGELCRERDPNIFELDYNCQKDCIETGIPLEIINKAIEEGKKCLLKLTETEQRQNEAGLYDYLLEKDPEVVHFHYPTSLPE